MPGNLKQELIGTLGDAAKAVDRTLQGFPQQTASCPFPRRLEWEFTESGMISKHFLMTAGIFESRVPTDSKTGFRGPLGPPPALLRRQQNDQAQQIGQRPFPSRGARAERTAKEVSGKKAVFPIEK